LQLTTIRSHDQYNTTIYSLDDRYRGVFGGRMVVFMNQDDMAEHQIELDSFVELESVTDGGDVRRTASGFKVKPYNIPRGSIAAYYPETKPSSAAELSRQEKQDAVRKVDPGGGKDDGQRRRPI
jgi:anaerobic selenocysteine-containing dehydrogenase